MGRRLPFFLILVLAAHAQMHRGAADRQASMNLDNLALAEQRPIPPFTMLRPMTKLERRMAGGASAPEGTLTAPARGGAWVFEGFQALLDGYITTPPDSNGAVGPDHVVTMLNTDVLIQDRAGRTRAGFPVPLGQFWAALGPFTKIYDPRILYDAANGRWIATAGANPWVANAELLLAVSATSDPAGNWNMFAIHTGTQGCWADYPELGFNQNWIVLSANLYTLPPSGNYARTAVFAFDKAALYQRGEATYSTFSDTKGELAPATDLDNSHPEAIYFAQALSGPISGHLRVSVLQGPVGHESFTAGAADIAVEDTWADGPATDTNFAPQSGAYFKLDTGDSRIQNCVMRAASLWCAHTVFVPAAKPVRSAVQWYQVDPATAQVVQRARVDDPTGAVFYAYPSIAVNRNRDVLLGFSVFSAKTYPSAGYALRAGADPPNTMQAGVILKSGEAPYVGPNADEGSNRWGDVSTTMVDPADDLSFWTIQEYAAVPTNYLLGRWATWWGRISSCQVSLLSCAGSHRGAAR
jgi:hypothetical protein